MNTSLEERRRRFQELAQSHPGLVLGSALREGHDAKQIPSATNIEHLPSRPERRPRALRQQLTQQRTRKDPAQLIYGEPQ